MEAPAAVLPPPPPPALEPFLQPSSTTQSAFSAAAEYGKPAGAVKFNTVSLSEEYEPIGGQGSLILQNNSGDRQAAEPVRPLRARLPAFVVQDSLFSVIFT